MANYRTRTVNYKPRFTDDEAYEMLPPTLRKALQESVQPWSSAWTLRTFNEIGLDKTVKLLRAADEQFMRKGWIPARGRRKALASSFVVCRVKPQRFSEVRD